MPVYRHGQDVYDILDEEIEGFEAQFPEATVEMHDGEDIYDIPVSEKEGFLSQYPTATYSQSKPLKTAQPVVDAYGMPMQPEVSTIEDAPKVEEKPLENLKSDLFKPQSTETPSLLNVGAQPKDYFAEAGAKAIESIRQERQAREYQEIMKPYTSSFGRKKEHEYINTSEGYVAATKIFGGEEANRRRDELNEQARLWMEAQKSWTPSSARRFREQTMEQTWYDPYAVVPEEYKALATQKWGKEGSEDAYFSAWMNLSPEEREAFVKREHIKSFFNEETANRMQGIRERALEEKGRGIAKSAMSPMGYYNNSAEAAMDRMVQDAGNVGTQTLKALDKAEEIKQAYKNHQLDENFFAGAYKGMKDGLTDIDNWTGLYMVGEMANLYDIADKMEKGEALSQTEEDFLDAQAYKLAVEAALADDLGWGYGSGNVTGASVPFMLQMLASPLSGASGKAIDKGFAAVGRRAIDKFGKGILKKLLTKAPVKKVVKGLVGTVGKGIGQTILFGSDRVAAGTMERHLGNEMVAERANEEFNAGVQAKAGEDLGTALFKAGVSTSMENISEFAGGAFIDDFTKMVGKKISKEFMDAMGGSVGRRMANAAARQNANKVFRAIANNKWGQHAVNLSKSVQNGMEWDGLLNEYLEEVLNNASNVMIGDMSMEDFTSLEKNAETLLGLAWTSGFFTASNAASRIGGYARGNIALKRTDRAARQIFTGDMQEKWDAYTQALSQADGYEEVEQLYKDLVADISKNQDKELAGAQMSEAAAYMTNYVKMMGMNAATEEADEEEQKTPAQKDIETAQGEGIAAQGTEEEMDVVEEMDESYNQLAGHLEGANVEEWLLQYGETAAKQLEAIRGSELDEQTKAMAEAYLTSAQRYEGLLIANQEEVDAIVDEAAKEFDANVNQELGSVIQVLTTQGKTAYVIQGNPNERENIRLRYEDGTTEPVSHAAIEKVLSQADAQTMRSDMIEGVRKSAVAEVVQRMQGAVPNATQMQMPVGHNVVVDGQAGVVAGVNADGTMQIQMQGGNAVSAAPQQVMDAQAYNTIMERKARARESARVSTPVREEAVAPVAEEAAAEAVAEEAVAAEAIAAEEELTEAQKLLQEYMDESVSLEDRQAIVGNNVAQAKQAAMEAQAEVDSMTESKPKATDYTSIAEFKQAQEQWKTQMQEKQQALDLARQQEATWSEVQKGMVQPVETATEQASAEVAPVAPQVTEDLRRAAEDYNQKHDTKALAEELGISAKRIQRVIDFANQVGVKMNFANVTRTQGGKGAFTNADNMAKDRTITLSKYQLAKGMAIEWVMGHELTHQIKADGNAANWGAYKQAIINALGQDAFDKRVKEQSEVYREAGAYQDMSANEFVETMQEEVCADAAGDMLLNPDNMNKMMGVPQSLASRIWSSLKNMVTLGLPTKTTQAVAAWQQLAEGKELTGEADERKKHSIVGTTGARALDKAEGTTVRMDNMDVAEEMEAAGKDAETIWLATGWERGADGKWKYEVLEDFAYEEPRAKAERLQDEYQQVQNEKENIYRYLNMLPARGLTEQQKAVKKEQNARLKKLIRQGEKLQDEIIESNFDTTLGELIGTDNNIIKAYPELASMPVSFVANSRFMDAGLKGAFDGEGIWINPTLENTAPTLLHEVQHAIQRIEGFARGGNTGSVKTKADALREDVRPLHEMMLDTPEWAERQRLQNRWFDETDAAEIAKIEQRVNEINESGVLDAIQSKRKQLQEKYGSDATVGKILGSPYAEDAEIWQQLPESFNDKYEAYRNLAGEAEARNVSARLNMSEEERRQTRPGKTEDVAREEQTVIYVEVSDKAGAQLEETANATRYSIVVDPQLIAELEASPKRKGYRNVVQREDGLFEAPMGNSLRGNGITVENTPFAMGQWEQSEEHPELVYGDNKITLVKPDGKTVADVNYNPYIHNRLNTLNAQFKQAWERPDLVYIETEVPETDLEGGYMAEHAHLSTGVHQWSNGALMLSRYDKPVRIVPWDEVAIPWIEKYKKSGVHFDIVPPALRPVLTEADVEIKAPHKGMGENCIKAYEEWKAEQEANKKGSAQSETSKASQGERGGAISDYSSSRRLPQESSEHLSHYSLASQKDVAKLQQNTQNTINSARKKLNAGGFVDIKSPEDAVRVISKTLKLSKSASSQSYYGELYEGLFDVEGETLKLRVSTHPATNDRMGNAPYDDKISIVIRKDGKHIDRSPHNGYKEFIYEPNETSLDEAANAIIEGVMELLQNGGDFVDKTGLAHFTEYPYIDAEGNAKFSITAEEQSIVDAAKANGTYMKAPNGEPTNLNEKQWAQVRTKAFKDWFGDWENDPENASKIVDENGEPMVVYHGSEEDFNVFDKTKGRANMDIQGMFFSPWEDDARGYGQNVRAFYLNIRKPANESTGYKALKRFQGQNGAGIKAREYLVSVGYDGLNNEDQEFVAFDSTQIKSATDNVGTFDAENGDIRYSMPGYSVASRIYGHPFTGAWQKFLQRAPKGVLKPGYGIIDESRLPEFADWYRMLVPEAEEYKEFVSWFLDDATATEKKHIQSVMDRVDKIVDDYRRLAEGDNSVLLLENNARFSITPDILAANERFNKELDEFKAKTHKGLLHLGKPGAILRTIGVDADEMTLSPSVLSRHLKKHNLTADDLIGLPLSVQTPILAYRHGDKNPNLVVVTEMDVKGGKLSVSLELDENGHVVGIDNIRSVHSKDATKEMARLGAMREGELEKALRWVEKEEVQDWLGIADLNRPIHTINPELSSVANVLLSFQNPPILEDESSQNEANATSGEQKYSLPARPAIPKRNEGEGIMEYAQRVANATEAQKAWDVANKTATDIDRQIKNSEEYRDILVQKEPQTIEEAASVALAGGKLLWNDYTDGSKVLKGVKSMMGWKEGEREKMFTMFASRENGGVSVERMGEEVIEICNQYNIPVDETDAMAGTNAVLEVLQSAQRPSDITGYIEHNRIEQVRRMIEEEQEMLSGERNRAYMDMYGMTYDDFVEIASTIDAEDEQERSDDKNVIAWLYGQSQRQQERITNAQAELEQLKRNGVPKTQYDAAYRALEQMKAKVKRTQEMLDEATKELRTAKGQATRQRKANMRYKAKKGQWKQVFQELRKAINGKNIRSIDKSTLNEIMRAVGNADLSGMAKLFSEAGMVEDIILGVNMRATQDRIDKLLATKTTALNDKGIATGKSVDASVQAILANVRKTLEGILHHDIENQIHDLRSQNWHIRHNAAGNLSQEQQEQVDANKAKIEELKAELSKELATNTANTEQAVNEQIEKLTEQIDNGIRTEEESAELMTTLALKRQMVAIHTSYQDTATVEALLRRKQSELRTNWVALHDGNIPQDKREEYRQKRKALQEQIAGLEAQVREGRQATLDAMQSFADSLEETITTGRANLKGKVQEQLQRRKEFVAKAIHDVNASGKQMQSVNEADKQENDKLPWYKRMFSPALRTFDYMLQKIATRTYGKDSWLYRQFMLGENGVMAAHDEYLRGMQTAARTLEDKAKEIFGKSYQDVMAESNRKKDIGIEILRDAEDYEPSYIPLKLTKGQATYIYMLWRMRDGYSKLATQGFTEEIMQRIEEYIGPDYIEWADWMQMEYLPMMREKYNARYREIYDTNMAAIDNYVPIRIHGQAIRKEVDLTDATASMPGMQKKNGALIQRTVNVNPIDISNNIFELIGQHIDEMEEFYAYAPVRRDLQYILSSPAFRNILNANESGTFQSLLEAARIATKTNQQPESAALKAFNDFMNKTQKGLVSGNIAYRNMTAIKQVLSAPAFIGYSQSPEYLGILAGNMLGGYLRNIPVTMFPLIPGIGHWAQKMTVEETAKGMPYIDLFLGETFRWCMREFPDFRERVTSGSAGDIRLEEKGFSKLLDKYTAIGMSANVFIDAVTVSVGLKSIYDYEMKKAEKRIQKMAVEMQMDEQWAEEEMRKASNAAKIQATLFANQTQQSSNPALLSPMQVSKNFMERSLTLYKNSPLGLMRAGIGGMRNLLRFMKGKKARRRMTEEYTRMFMQEGFAENEAKKRAISYLNSEARKGAFVALLEGYVMNVIWNLGSKGLLGFMAGGGDDDKERTIGEWVWDGIKHVAKNTFGSAMPFVNDALEGRLPAIGLTTSEAEKAWKDIKKQLDENGISLAFALTGMRYAAKFGGVDMQVWANTMDGYYRLFSETGNSDENTLALMLILNSPHSNRMAVARELYKGKSKEEFQRAIELAGRYNQPVWTFGREMTDKVESDMAKWYLSDNATDEEKQRTRCFEEMEERIDNLDTVEDALKMFDEVSDTELRKKISSKIDQISKPEDTFAEKVDRKKENALAEDDADMEGYTYMKMADSQDLLEEKRMRAEIDMLKPIVERQNDLFEEYGSNSAVYARFMAEHGAEIRRYKTLKAYSRAIQARKRKMDEEGSDVQTLYEEIKELYNDAQNI